MKRWYVLSHFIKKREYKDIVELGVWKGKNAKALLALHPEINYTGVDLYKGDVETYSPGENGHEWDHEEYLKDLQEVCSQHGSARILRLDTVKAAEEFDDNSVDLVFIDADHSYEGVKNDIEAWLPKVKHGGIISGHDYCEAFPGVVKAVTEHFPNINVFDDNVWVKYV